MSCYGWSNELVEFALAHEDGAMLWLHWSCIEAVGHPKRLAGQHLHACEAGAVQVPLHPERLWGLAAARM
jgi:hypothetical protein